MNGDEKAGCAAVIFVVGLWLLGLVAAAAFWSFVGYLAYLLVVHFTS